MAVGRRGGEALGGSGNGGVAVGGRGGGFGSARYSWDRHRQTDRQIGRWIDIITDRHMYMYNCDFFSNLRAHFFVLALSQTSGGVGTILPSGSRCWRFGRDPCSVSRVASLLNFFGLVHTSGKSPGFRNIPGD